MAKVLSFPAQKIESVTVRDGRAHCISVEVLDEVMPRPTRWMLQFAIQEVAGFSALKGFTDNAVAESQRHRFDVRNTRSVRQFVAETSNLGTEGKVAVWVYGQRVRPQIKRSA